MRQSAEPTDRWIRHRRPTRSAPRRSRHVTAIVLALAIAVLGGCTSGVDGTATTTGSSVLSPGSGTTGSAVASTGADTSGIYLSIGDSYAAGYRPLPQGGFGTTKDGFAYQLADRLAADGDRLELVNLACTGATTSDVLRSRGCPPDKKGPGAPEYGSTQLAAALELIKRRPGEVKLITVVLGGNDFQPCFTQAVTAMAGSTSPPSSAAPSADAGGGSAAALPQEVSDTAQQCLDQQLAVMSTNLGEIVGQLRAAVGSDVPIVGLSYPDVFLGLYTTGQPAIADASIGVFSDQINPRLQRAYQQVDATFVDVTKAFGAYEPMTRTQNVAGIGELPVPVARICTLTFFCSVQDVHPQPAGHTVITDQIMAALGR